MQNFLKEYTFQILCLSILIGIIQLLIPNCKLKKDVIFVMMIVITIMLIHPAISFLNQDIDLDKIYEDNLEIMEIEVAKKYYEENYQSLLKKTFEDNLREDIVSRLKRAGYKVNSVKCQLDEETLEPKELHLQIETEDGFVQPVRIEVLGQINTPKYISPEVQSNIEKILMDNYGVNRKNITINGGK